MLQGWAGGTDRSDFSGGPTGSKRVAMSAQHIAAGVSKTRRCRKMSLRERFHRTFRPARCRRSGTHWGTCSPARTYPRSQSRSDRGVLRSRHLQRNRPVIGRTLRGHVEAVAFVVYTGDDVLRGTARGCVCSARGSYCERSKRDAHRGGAAYFSRSPSLSETRQAQRQS